MNSETPEKPKLPKINLPDFKSQTLPTKPDLQFPRFERDSFIDQGKPGIDTKMVWMNESAVVNSESETPVVGTESLADCLGIGVQASNIKSAGADHMRFDPTHDIEGDNIGYAYGRLVHLARRIIEAGGEDLNIFLVNTDPKIRGEERNRRLKRVLERALQDERLKEKVRDVQWIDVASGFKIDTRTSTFSSW